MGKRRHIHHRFVSGESTDELLLLVSGSFHVLVLDWLAPHNASHSGFKSSSFSAARRKAPRISVHLDHTVRVDFVSVSVRIRSHFVAR